MTPTEFVASIPGFAKLKPVEQIKRFCWLAQQSRGTDTFSADDLWRFYTESKCSPPSAVAPFLASLSNRKEPFLLRRAQGKYTLSRLAHDQLDPVLGKREATIAVDKLLEGLPAKLTSSSEREYLEEALKCFRCGAFRATVVMTWNVAFAHLCALIFDKHITDFNAQLPRSYPKASVPSINKIDDLQVFKEFEVLQVAKSAGIITNSVHCILKQKLDRRNGAAHPSGVRITAHTAEEYIQDLVQNFVIRY